MTQNIKRGDTVICVGFEIQGLVRRVSLKGGWADVWWRTDNQDWMKRMQLALLRKVGE